MLNVTASRERRRAIVGSRRSKSARASPGSERQAAAAPAVSAERRQSDHPARAYERRHRRRRRRPPSHARWPPTKASISSLQGTGPSGRISKADVMAARRCRQGRPGASAARARPGSAHADAHLRAIGRANSVARRCPNSASASPSVSCRHSTTPRCSPPSTRSTAAR